MLKNNFDLTGKVALITGGNGGIGLAFALGIAKAGGAVCIWGRNKEKNEQALKLIQNTGAKAVALICDVSDENSVQECFKLTLDSFGRVDGCFANAGIMGNEHSIIDRPFSDWRKLMSINLDGVFLTLQAAARHMIERAKNGDAFGRLVITSSMASRMGIARHEDYGASKSAVNGLSKALAVELARYKITSNSILPGWVASEMTQSMMDNPKFTEKVISRVPLRRWGRAEEFENIAVYLMSEGSGYHTGDEIVIDGGYTKF